MDIIFAIILFVAVSLMSDAIEGKRKKRQQSQLPPTADTPRTSSRQSRPEVMIPPIKGSPKERKNYPQTARPSAKPVERPIDARYMEMLARREKQSSKEVAEPLQVTVTPTSHATDIHTDVLLNAIAYAQILQPPKAYQYMATRSCRGDWQNNK